MKIPKTKTIDNKMEYILFASVIKNFAFHSYYLLQSRRKVYHILVSQLLAVT